MAKKRVLRNGSAQDQGSISSASFNINAGGTKTLQAGPDFQKISTNTFTSGQTANVTAISILPGSMIWAFNNSAATTWIVLSTDPAVSAPSSITTGIPIAANSWLQLNMGENSVVRTSSANVGVYIVNDDTTLVDAN